MSTSVLIVERPGPFRDGLREAVIQHGAHAHVRDDAMEALAALEGLAPNVVLVSDDAGPPGAISLCRLVRRKLQHASVYRLGEPSLADSLDERSLLLPRAVGPNAIASAMLDQKSPAQSSAWATHRAWDAPLGSLELGPLLLAIHARWLTGRLILIRPGTEREISFVRGMPVHANSSVLAERLGVIGMRRDLFNETQLEQALDLAHVRQLRVGEALLELGALDAPRLYAVLAVQLVEQMAAACNSGACHARFVLDPSVAMQGPLLRLSPLTALLHAVQQTPADDVERVLEELSERALANEGLPPVVEQWLSDLQPELVKHAKEANSVRSLRTRLRESWPRIDDTAKTSSDAVTLALLRSGAFRMPGRSSMMPADLRAGMRTLSPPSIASAIVRCTRSSFEEWRVSAFTGAHSPLERSIDEYLHGRRAPMTARALALLGPQTECEPAHAELYALYLRASGAQQRFAGLGFAPGATIAELRVRCHGMQKRLDALELEHAAPVARAQIMQTRAHLDRVLAAMPGLDPSPPAPRPTSAAPPPVPSGPAARPQAKPEPKQPAGTLDLKLTAAVEPLLQQGKWQELHSLLASRDNDPLELPAGLALLYAIALKEDSVQAATDSTGKPVAHAETLGIRAVSQLLGVPEQSAMAVVIAKRVLRRRPLDWNQKPPARVSALLVVVALLVGALVGLGLQANLVHLFWK